MSEPKPPAAHHSVGMAPIGAARPGILILGSLPGAASLREQRYYAHPRNQFWPILFDTLAPGTTETSNYETGVSLLAAHGIFVWDVLAAANRLGSLDAAIKNPVANDFAELIGGPGKQPALFFNGQAAHKLFKRYVVRPQNIELTALAITVLPSTSPAYTVPYAQKRDRWHDAITAHLKR